MTSFQPLPHHDAGTDAFRALHANRCQRPLAERLADLVGPPIPIQTQTPESSRPLMRRPRR